MTRKKRSDSDSAPARIQHAVERATKPARRVRADSDRFSTNDFFNRKDEQAIKAEVDELLARYIMRDETTGRFVTPGAAIMVIKEGRKVFETYQGAAKGIAKGEGEYVELSEDTIFDLASVSKQFTAMAIILLKDSGRLGELNYDAPLSSFFPSEHVPEVSFPPEVGESVTVRHLLNHTSGLKDIITLFTNRKYANPRIHHHYPRSLRAFQEQDFEPTSRQALERLAEQDLAFPPDTKWEYSNSGYIILAQIVESITGVPFPQFMKENVFSRLGMDNTFVMDEKTPIPPDRVTSYDRGWNDFHDIDYTPFNRIYGDGNVHTTLRDMEKWDHALQVIFRGEDFPDEEPLVNERSIREAFDVKNPTNLHPAIKYTSGWFFGFYRGGHGRPRPLMWHSGGWVGLRTMILRFFTRERLTVIVLANNMHLPAGTVACRVAKIFLNEEPPGKPSPLGLEQLQEVVKNYHLEQDVAVNGSGEIAYSDDITLEGEELFVKDWYLEKYKLAYSSRVTADVNKEKLRGEITEPPADEKSFVFYMEDLDGNVLEGFDIFRYDIVGKKMFPRPATRNKRGLTASQRS